MKKLLLALLLLPGAAFAQTSVQKNSSGVVSNGPVQFGSGNTLSAVTGATVNFTGATQIGIVAGATPYTGITGVPTVSLLGNPTGGTANASAITLGASLQFVSSALNTIQAITTASSPTFAGLTLSSLTTNHGLVTTNGSGVLSTTLTPTGLTSVNGLALTSTAATLDVASGSTLQTLGGFTEALTFTGNTAITFPTSGTLATTAGTVAPSGSINTNGIGYWVGANSLASTAALASGQILIGSSGVAPVPAAINSTNGGVQVQNGAGSITMALQTAIYGPTSIGVNTGTTASATALQVVDTGTASPRGITNDQYNTGTNSAQFNARKARGTFATPTTIVTGDVLARFLAWGHDGSNFIESGNLRFTSTGTIAATRVPSQAEIWTSTNALPSVLTKAATFGADQSLAVVGPVSASNLSLGGTLTTANSLTTSGNFSLALTTTANTSLTLPTSGTLATTSQIPSLPVSGANGGTGVANTGLTITLGGNVSTANSLTTTGNFSLALATTGATSVTLPTTGTLATTSQIASGANPTATISSAAGTVTNGSAATFLRSDGAPALPATMTGVNSVTSAAGTALTLGTGTSGTAISIASATNVVNLPGTTSAASAITGALTVGNGTAATNVGIGGGNVNAGGVITGGSVLVASQAWLGGSNASIEGTSGGTSIRASRSTFDTTQIIDLITSSALNSVSSKGKPFQILTQDSNSIVFKTNNTTSATVSASDQSWTFAGTVTSTSYNGAGGSTMVIGPNGSAKSFSFAPANVTRGAWLTGGIFGLFDTATATDSTTSGTTPSAVLWSIGGGTIAATNVSTTTTNAATLFVGSKPTAGTNETFTHAYSAWFGDPIRVDGGIELNSNGNVNSNTTAGSVEISGGNASGNGAGLVVTGSTAGTASTGTLRTGSTTRMTWNATSFSWDSTVTAAFANTTSATTSLLGAVVVGNGTAATSVGIGAGNIVAGATVTAGGLAETLATFKGTVTLTAGAGTITSAAITSTAVVILSRTTTSGAGVYPQIDVGSGSATITGTVTDGGTYNWRVIQ